MRVMASPFSRFRLPARGYASSDVEAPETPSSVHSAQWMKVAYRSMGSVGGMKAHVDRMTLTTNLAKHFRCHSLRDVVDDRG
jgi:hypothetical protein